MTYPPGPEPRPAPPTGAPPAWTATPTYLPAVPGYGQPVVHHVHHVPVATKSLGVALLLWFFLTSWGADQFYLGRVGAGIGMIVLNVLGWATIWFFGVGLVFWIPLAIWAIVNLCLLSGWVTRHNVRAAAAAGYGPGGYRPY